MERGLGLLYFILSHNGGTRRGKYFLGWLRTTTIDIVQLWAFVSLSQVVYISLCYECKYKPANGGAKWRRTNPPAGPNENEAWAF